MRTTQRRMREFADHLTRKYCVAFEHRGSRVILKLQQRDVAAINVSRNAVVGLTPDLQIGEQHRRFVDLLRFKMAIQTDKAIKAPNVHSGRNSQCTKYACFDALTQAFREEWAVFNDDCADASPEQHEARLGAGLAGTALVRLGGTLKENPGAAKTSRATPIGRASGFERPNGMFSHQLAQLGALFLMQQNCQMFQRLFDGEDATNIFEKMIEMLHRQKPESWQNGTNDWEKMESVLNGYQNKDCLLDVMQKFSEQLSKFNRAPS